MAKKLLYLAAVTLLLTTAYQGIAKADTALANDSEQTRPIKLGTSGGNINDRSTGFCCGGTLGALVKDGRFKYILSNNHVLARINKASRGENIIQPGLIDQDPVCFKDVDDTVARLRDFERIRFYRKNSIPINNVDAAIARVIPGTVDPTGYILDIGLISSETVEATVEQSVKKSGRTSGLKTGTVSAVDATIDVWYYKECGSTDLKVARFQNQIIIAGSGFSAPGDSGSLVVENVASQPRAVGLLFAGNSSGTLTAANSINDVLETFGVTMVGGAETDPVGSITGTVTNRVTGSPIENATVTLRTGGFAVTDPDGIYLIEDVPVGRHHLKVTAEGFLRRRRIARVYQDQESVLDFVLNPYNGQGDLPQAHQAAVSWAKKIKKRYEKKLFEIDGVVGTGISLTETRKPVIEIYLKDDPANNTKKFPTILDGIPVRTVVTGQFEAF